MGGSRTTYTYSTNTVYEPDRVKEAEIKAKAAFAVEKLRGENIKLQEKAAIEMMETNAKVEQLIIDAKIKGFSVVSQKLIEFAKEINMLGELRIKLLEQASGESLRKMNEHYLEFKKKIEEDGNRFLTNDFPKMLNNLEKFDKDSGAYDIYKKNIDQYVGDFIVSQNEFTKSVLQQQQEMFASNKEIRMKIIEHTNQIVSKRIYYLEKSVESEIKKINDGALRNVLNEGIENGAKRLLGKSENDSDNKQRGEK